MWCLYTHLFFFHRMYNKLTNLWWLDSVFFWLLWLIIINFFLYKCLSHLPDDNNNNLQYHKHNHKQTFWFSFNNQHIFPFSLILIFIIIVVNISFVVLCYIIQLVQLNYQNHHHHIRNLFMCICLICYHFVTIFI